MKSREIKYAIVLFILLVLGNSCRKGPSYWDDNFVAPVAHGGLSLANLFPDTTVKSNPDNTLKIAFEANIINYQLDSLLKVRDTTTVSSFVWPGVAYPIDPGMPIPTSS